MKLDKNTEVSELKDVNSLETSTKTETTEETLKETEETSKETEHTLEETEEISTETSEDSETTEETETETSEDNTKHIDFKKVHCKVEGLTDKIQKALNGKNGNFYKALIVLFVTAPLMLYLVFSMGVNKVKRFNPEQKIDYSGIDIGVTMSKESLTLDYIVNNAVIKLDNGKYIEINKDTLDNVLNTDLNIINNKFTDNGLEYDISEDLAIDSFDNYNDMMYIVYKNKESTGMRELLVSKDLKDGLQIDGLQSVNSSIYESNSSTSVNAFTNTYDNSVIYYCDQLLGGEIGTKTLVSRVQAIEDNMSYSTLDENGHEEVTIRFDELADLKLSKLSSLKDAPGVYFSKTDGVLRLHNYIDDKAYVFVSHVNNNLFFCNASDLLETNCNNLYVTRGFDDPENSGYRTFVITTENNMYAFRVSSEAPDSLITELLNEFGYNREDLTIKPVQEMIANEVVEDSLVNSENQIETSGAEETVEEATEESEVVSE